VPSLVESDAVRTYESVFIVPSLHITVDSTSHSSFLYLMSLLSSSRNRFTLQGQMVDSSHHHHLIHRRTSRVSERVKQWKQIHINSNQSVHVPTYTWATNLKMSDSGQKPPPPIFKQPTSFQSSTNDSYPSFHLHRLLRLSVYAAATLRVVRLGDLEPAPQSDGLEAIWVPVMLSPCAWRHGLVGDRMVFWLRAGSCAGLVCHEGGHGKASQGHVSHPISTNRVPGC
jgi:hypothetical protein